MPNDSGLKVAPFALAIAVLIYLGIWSFDGGYADILGLDAAVVELLLLAGLTLTKGVLPPRLPLTVPAILFGVVLALGVFSLLPIGPPLAHPIWSYVRGAPASISTNPLGTRFELIKLTGIGAMFVIGVSLGFDRERAEKFFFYITLGGIAYCLWALASFVAAPNAIYGSLRPYGLGRMGGSFLSPNSAATLFASFTVLSQMSLMRPLVRARHAGSRLRLDDVVDLWPQAALFVFALPCLLLTASRGGLVAVCAGAVAGLGYLVWIKGSSKSLSAGFAAVSCLVLFMGALVFLFAGNNTAARIGETDPLRNDRLLIFSSLWPTFKAAPWFGYGMGAFRVTANASMTLKNSLAFPQMASAHNVYLQWLLLQGVTGAAAMIGCVAWIIVKTARGVARRATQQTLGAACLAIAVVFAVHGLVDFAFEVNALACFFAVMLGLGYGIAERPSSRR